MVCSRFLIVSKSPKYTVVASRLFSSATRAVESTASSKFRFPIFENTGQLFEYAEKNMKTMEPTVMCQFATHFFYHVNNKMEDRRELLSNEVHRSVVSRLGDIVRTDGGLHAANACSALANCSQNLPFVPKHVKDIGEDVAKLVVEGKMQIRPDQFAYLIKHLVSLEAADLTLMQYLKTELPNIVPHLTRAAARSLLSSITILRLRDSNLANALLEKTGEGLAEFSNRDVVATLSLYSKIGRFNMPVLQKCADLVKDHMTLFDKDEIGRAHV